MKCTAQRSNITGGGGGGAVAGGEDRRTRRETCPSSTLSTTNITHTGLESNTGLRCVKTNTDRLDHGITLPKQNDPYSAD